LWAVVVGVWVRLLLCLVVVLQPGLYGDLGAVANAPLSALAANPGNMVGLGMAPEGIFQNYIVFDLLAEVGCAVPCCAMPGGGVLCVWHACVSEGWALFFAPMRLGAQSCPQNPAQTHGRFAPPLPSHPPPCPASALPV
jgi:hypothetical protein